MVSRAIITKGMIRKYKYTILVLGMALIALFMYVNRASLDLFGAYQKCPEDYTEDSVDTEEYKNALTTWTSEFFEINPDAMVSDWLLAKSKLWRDNGCFEALEQLKKSGEVKDLKSWELVDYEVQRGIQNTLEADR